MLNKIFKAVEKPLGLGRFEFLLDFKLESLKKYPLICVSDFLCVSALNILILVKEIIMTKEVLSVKNEEVCLNLEVRMDLVFCLEKVILSLYSFSTPASFTPFTCGGFSKLWRFNVKTCCLEEFLLWFFLSWCYICYFCLCWQWKFIYPHFDLGGIIKMDEAIPFGDFFFCAALVHWIHWLELQEVWGWCWPGGKKGIENWEKWLLSLGQWAFKLPRLFFDALS